MGNKAYCTCLVLILTVAAYSKAAEWHGIVPLHSSRVDVERLLGHPKPGTNGSYRTKDERVLILYSDGPCGINSGGWNVPRDTVISISVLPNDKPKFADLKLDKEKYKRRQDSEVVFLAYYVNDEKGISYEVNTSEGVVEAVEYTPTTADNYLRCPTSGGDIYDMRIRSRE